MGKKKTLNNLKEKKENFPVLYRKGHLWQKNEALCHSSSGISKALSTWVFNLEWRVSHWLPLFLLFSVLTLSDLCALHAWDEKKYVKSQWSCSQVQLTPLRVSSPSILNYVNANQVGVEDLSAKMWDEYQSLPLNTNPLFFFLPTTLMVMWTQTFTTCKRKRNNKWFENLFAIIVI